MHSVCNPLLLFLHVLRLQLRTLSSCILPTSSVALVPVELELTILLCAAINRI